LKTDSESLPMIDP